MSYRPETEVLLLLLQPGAGEDLRQEAERRILPPLDWDRLLDSAERHWVTNLVWRRLNQSGIDSIPPATQRLLQEMYRRNMARHALLSAELARIVEYLELHQAPVIPLKGPVLDCLLYDGRGIRVYGDLDILVRPEDAPLALKLMRRLGYRNELNLPDPQTAPITRYGGELALEGDSGKQVDLHWRLSDAAFPQPLRLDRVWERAQPMDWNGIRVRSLADEDLFLYLCHHGGKHLWSDLSLWCDFAQFVASRPHLDLESLIEEAGARHFRRMALLGLSLISRCLGVALPHAIQAGIAGDPEIAKLSAIVARVIDGVDREPPQRAVLPLLDRSADRLRYLLSSAFLPRVSDWRWVKLERRYHLAYYALRPIRLLGKYGKDVISGRPSLTA